MTGCQSKYSVFLSTNFLQTRVCILLFFILILKSALAGTATSKFTDVMEAVFRVEEEFIPKPEEEELDKAEEEVPAEGVVTKGAEWVPNLPLVVKVLNLKQVARLHPKVNKVNILKWLSIYSKMPLPCSLLMLNDTCTLGSLPNI